MNKNNSLSDPIPHCAQCGKNLSIIKQDELIVEGDDQFCRQSCLDLFIWQRKSSGKGKWSKTRSPFVSLKKVLT
ncbi:hypothetical protein DDZ13_07535 [Coraliomargarita sinensis]|uniref:Uncharacterized protein n=2 Tax=Coraliomargarita sinensis TaxID=2174842 RepID=A0A317ZFM0_9BACT|nr:hypothetical protein DDZ13_07535 [Coraliomargarita sinensis]